MEQRQPEEYEIVSYSGLLFVAILVVLGSLLALLTHQFMWAFALSGIYGVAYQLVRVYDRL